MLSKRIWWSINCSVHFDTKPWQTWRVAMSDSVRPGIPFCQPWTGTHDHPHPPPTPSSSTNAAVKLAARAHYRSSFSWKVSVAWRVFLPWGINWRLNVPFSELLDDLAVLVVVFCPKNLWGWLFNSSVNVDNHRTGCGCPCSSIIGSNQRDSRPSAARSGLVACHSLH